jgi:RNA polymerase sigma-70 factor (ECF subfamily)
MRPEFAQASDLLRQNTPEAIAEAIGLLQRAVYSFSMKMCGHREDAEDTAQEVLFRSLKHFPKLQEPAALAGWLYTVARNRCHRLRGTMHDSPNRKLSLDDLMPEETELKSLLLDSESSPEGAALRSERRDLIHTAVLHIPSQLRIVLVLHDMEELSTQQVAQILDLREGSVRVRLHRARLALRKEMSLRLRQGVREESKTSPEPSQTPKRIGAKENGRAGRKPKECRALFAGLSEYLDGRVDPQRAQSINAHMEQCPKCVAFLRDLSAAIERCKSMEAECDQAVTSRLRAMLTEEYLRVTGSRPAPLSRSPHRQKPTAHR